MAGNMKGGGGNPSLVGNWVSKNYFIKIILYCLIIMGTFYSYIFFFDQHISNGIVLKNITSFSRNISYILNNIPIYKNYASYFESYSYFEKYSYNIFQGLFNGSSLNMFYVTFWGKSFFEFIPFFIMYILFLPTFKELKDFYKNYNGQLKWRNLNPIKNPIKELRSIIEEEGTNGEKKEEYNPYEVTVMKNLYIKTDIYKKLYNDKENGFTKEVPGLLDIYEVKLYNGMKKYLYEEKNKKYIKEFGREINRELYFPSLRKEVTFEELYEYYKYAMYFWFAKQNKNFSIHEYTLNLNAPREIKKLCKWMVGKNAPRTVFVPDNPNVPVREAKMKAAELYYRIYRIRKYLGIEHTYMDKFLKRINSKIDN